MKIALKIALKIIKHSKFTTHKMQYYRVKQCNGNSLMTVKKPMWNAENRIECSIKNR